MGAKMFRRIQEGLLGAMPSKEEGLGEKGIVVGFSHNVTPWQDENVWAETFF